MIRVYEGESVAKNKSPWVLVDDAQVVASPNDVLETVRDVGFSGASGVYGYSESHLRAFLKRNGVVSKRTVTYEQVPQVPVPAGPEDEVF